METHHLPGAIAPLNHSSNRTPHVGKVQKPHPETSSIHQVSRCVFEVQSLLIRCDPRHVNYFALLNNEVQEKQFNNEVQEKHFRRLDQSSNEIVLGVTRQRCFPKWTEIWRTLWQTRGPLSFRHFLFRDSRKCADTMLELADLQRRLHVKFDSLKPSEGFCHDCAIHGCHATWGYQQALIHVFSIAEWRCVSQYFGSLCPTDRLR